MPAVCAALALLAVSARAAAADCRRAYSAEYQTQWELSRADWNKACADGEEAGPLLRKRQAAFLDACYARFTAAVKAGRRPESTVRAVCAQGVPGRARLGRELGVPEPEQAPTADVLRARSGMDFPRGLGQLSAAVKAAQAGWKPDACLSRLKFSRSVKVRDGGLVDDYEYMFYSKADRGRTYQYVSSEGVGARGELRRKAGSDHCLDDTQLDIGAAVEKARKAGLEISYSGLLGLEASLDFMDPKRVEGRGPAPNEAERRAVDAVAGRSFWHVRARETSVLVDAVKGTILYMGRAVTLEGR